MANELKRRTEELVKQFVDLGDYYAEKVVAVNEDGTAISAGGGGGGGGTEFAEDSVHTNGDLGSLVLAVRNDPGTALAGASGDYIPLATDSAGALWVRTAAGSGAQAEDAIAATGFSGTAILGVRRDAEASTVNADGDFSEVQIDANGRLKTNNRITAADIATPTDVQAIYRTQSFLTTALLAVSGVYTGVGVDALNFRRITGKVFASHPGTLHVDHSDDNAVWDSVEPLAVAATTGYGFDFPIFARYIRLRYVNGTSPQTTFRLSGYLSAA